MRKRSINKRYEYFKKEIVFYSQISDNLNLTGDKKGKVTSSTKQLRIEKWIIDNENYRIRAIILKRGGSCFCARAQGGK
jgi:hypothetical protein